MKNILTVAMLFLSIGLFAQNKKAEKKDTKKVEVTHAQFLGKTLPLREVVPMAGTSAERRKMGKDRKREVPNFIGRRMPTGGVPEGSSPKGADPVKQEAINHSMSTALEPLVNIEGMNEAHSGGVSPPDVCGEIGSNYYIQMVNASRFRVFDRDGNIISAPVATNTIWSQVNQSPQGDPIIMYDAEADRWIITEFPAGNFLLLAISETNDPMGSWLAYAFATPSFPDYPKYSIWPNAYCLTTNESGAGNSISYFINREEILAGVATPAIQRITLPGISGGPGFFVPTPVDWTGVTPPPADAKPMILVLKDDAWGSENQDGISVFHMDIDWDNPANTTWEEQFVPSAAFNTAACAAPGAGFACIPQLNGGGIDGIPETIMHQVHYRNFCTHETMVLNFLVNADGSPVRAGIRWMELRRPVGGEWSVYQEGTFAPDDGLHRFMGGIAMDGSGNIGLGYSISSSGIYPGLGFTGRRANDPLGEMTIDEYVIVEGESASGTRYGDYAQMTVDPVNDKTFWYTGEYMQPNRWGTRIFSFEMRDTNDLAPKALLHPANGETHTTAEIVEVEISNEGLTDQTVFEVGFIFENGAPVVETINQTLAVGETYTHTFSPTVDMLAVGDYEFKIFTSLSGGDDAPLNDTLCMTRSTLPRFDAAITDISGFNQLNCGSEIPVSILLNNLGTEPLTSATITVNLNGSLFQTIDWTGSLNNNESEVIDLMLSGFTGGMNEITATVSEPSGMMDEVAENNSITRTFEALTDGVDVSLLLITDDYPDETTWEVVDENGNVLFSGGSYSGISTLYTEQWCLDPEGCYEFTIFDSAGDGICCGFGLGNYAIVDADGNPLASSTGEFGFSETIDFCATFQCMMTADIDISPASAAGANDGTIMIFQQNGVGPFMYSIDGGLNFQASNTFDNLAAGDYTVVVTGDSECLYEAVVNIPACTLSFTAETTPETESNSEDGTIVITANDGIGNFSYSINGGNPQSSPIFNGLGTGEYTVTVQDEAGCSATTVVMVDIETSSSDKFTSQLVEVFPNPTTGVFRVKISGLERTSPLLPLIIYDANGKLVHSIQIARYDGVYTGQVSLVTQAPGTYFVRFIDEGTDRLVKVIKN